MLKNIGEFRYFVSLKHKNQVKMYWLLIQVLLFYVYITQMIAFKSLPLFLIKKPANNIEFLGGGLSIT